MTAQYRQPLPPPFPPPSGSSHPYNAIYNQSIPAQDYKPYGGQPHPGIPALRQPAPQPPSSEPPGLFTLFTTTDLRILRATNGSANLIGYHPEHLLNYSLLDWLHPSDRHLLDNERIKLVSQHSPHAILSTHRDLYATIHQRSERELLSPAVGMKDQYPNQNVRLVRSDQQYSLFNIRLHLGGGMGASIYQPETHDRVYLVISCLLVPDQHVPPLLPLRAPSVAPTTNTANSSYGPPTPITPMGVGAGASASVGPPSGGLPSFSSIAAGVEAPPPPLQQSSMRYGATPYSSRPGTGTGTGAGIGPHQQASANYYSNRGPSQHQHQQQTTLPPPLATSFPSSVQSTPTMSTKSPSPSPHYRHSNPINPNHSRNEHAYPLYDYPPPNQGYYLDDGYRASQTHHQSHSANVQDEWRRHPGDGKPPSSVPPEPHPDLASAMQTPTSAIPIDYSRRPWET